MVENFGLDNSSLSFFASGDFDVTDRLTLTGGVAYTDDKKTASGNIVATDKFSAVDFVATGAAVGVPLAYRATTCTAATRPLCNPLLGLRAVQFLPQFLNFPNAVESGKTHDSKWT